MQQNTIRPSSLLAAAICSQALVLVLKARQGQRLCPLSSRPWPWSHVTGLDKKQLAVALGPKSLAFVQSICPLFQVLVLGFGLKQKLLDNIRILPEYPKRSMICHLLLVTIFI